MQSDIDVLTDSPFCHLSWQNEAAPSSFSNCFIMFCCDSRINFENSLNRTLDPQMTVESVSNTGQKMHSAKHRTSN